MIKKALVSVSDKTGIVPFCTGLSELGIEILSTGGTARLLAENNIPVREVSSYTGFPEIMDGRVKTLHPKIHGGLLCRPGTDDEVMAENDIHAIGLVVVNLYPFEATVSKPDCQFDDAIENIDIGGPAMLRASAKNHAHVGVVVDADDYDNVLDELRNNNASLADATRFYLAHKTFAHTANYDANVSNYLGSQQNDSDASLVYPKTYTSQFHKKQGIFVMAKIHIKRRPFIVRQSR